MFSAGATLNVKLLKALDDDEKHDMHTPEAGVLHTSSSFNMPHTVRAISLLTPDILSIILAYWQLHVQAHCSRSR